MHTISSSTQVHKLANIPITNKKTLGAWNLLQSETGYEATAMAVLTRHEGWSKEEVSILVAKAKNDSQNRDIHGLLNLWVSFPISTHSLVY